LLRACLCASLAARRGSAASCFLSRAPCAPQPLAAARGVFIVRAYFYFFFLLHLYYYHLSRDASLSYNFIVFCRLVRGWGHALAGDRLSL
jgi:hypothetical protein